ncbi:MAG: hypothetical protein ACRC7O_05840, partial [Fimbriiglobus sp.]
GGRGPTPLVNQIPPARPSPPARPPGSDVTPPFPVQPPSGMLPAPVPWNKRRTDDEDIIRGSVGFVSGPSAGDHAAPGRGGITPAPLAPTARKRPTKTSFPWIILALAVGAGAGIAVVALLAFQ